MRAYPTHCFAALHVTDHVPTRLVLCIDPSFGSLDGEGINVHDAECAIDNLALHKPHDFVDASRASVDHLYPTGYPEDRPSAKERAQGNEQRKPDETMLSGCRRSNAKLMRRLGKQHMGGGEVSPF